MPFTGYQGRAVGQGGRAHWKGVQRVGLRRHGDDRRRERQQARWDAHHYYQDIIGRLKADPKDVQHIQDFWGDPLTAAGAQSPDGKAAYVQLNLVGNQGETSANNSVAAVRKIVDSIPAPKGVKAYVTGPAAVEADGLRAATRQS